jgi:alcohol dehydrogenase, propanol-preferring
VQALPTTTLALVEVERPQPAAGELLVQVEACGICGTDLHILEGSSYRPELPFVLGHEPVGRVTAAEPELAPECVGRRVTLTLFEGCGVCAYCRRGEERVCPDMRSVRGVIDAAGGFAEFMTVPVRQAVEVPRALAAAEAAALVDAGATAMNAADVIGAHERASSVIVVGGGPVGFVLAEILRSRGVRALVVERQAPRREALRALDHSVVESLGAVIAPAMVVADCAGTAAVAPAALELLAPKGMLVVVGYTQHASFDLAPIARKELTVRGIRSGSRDHLEGVLRLAADGAIRLPPIETWPMTEINAALRGLREGHVAGKAVVVNPDTVKEAAWTS